MRIAFACALAVLASGCYRELIAVDDPDGAPPPWDAGFVLPTSKCEEPTGVDLLFVIDNSNSMTEEQESLAEQLPSFVRALVDPPDEDGDGELDWLPIVDLHIGVITTDMGTGGHTVPTCARSDFGDDGILRTAGRTDVDGCAASYPSYFAYDASSGSTDALAFDVGCVARTGTGGCGFEQQLEATLKALSPATPTSYTGASYEPPAFFGGSLGHGDGANRGFVRDDTLLAVVIVTDEEDCSARDPELFDPSSLTYTADLNLRCFRYGEMAVHPVERYVAGLSALRARRPDLLAIGLVVGVPVDLAVEAPSYEDFRRMLDDDRMQERVDPAMPRLVPSCETERGLAFPPRRLVRVAQSIGPGRSTVQSICQADFSPAAAAIARLFGQRACERFE